MTPSSCAAYRTTASGRAAARVSTLSAGPGEAEVTGVTVTGWPRVGAMSATTKWEYLTAPVLVHATKQILDNFGQDGWELVQIVPGMNPENLVAYFKRPVQ